MTDWTPSEIIRWKRDGHPVEPITLEQFVRRYTEGTVADEQMSAFLMAVFFRGFDDQETTAYINALKKSGRVLSWDQEGPPVVDKHSTGGLGDKTSLIVGPLLAAAGLRVPMMAGRGLGHTGGTVDKLESIPGFQSVLHLEDFQAQVNRRGLAFIAQSEEICPADKKLYALRDVTGTVESIPLICGSILSKKLAEGLQALVLDVKFGSGAFFKKEADALRLAQELQRFGELQGPSVSVLLTDMNQPLGPFSGNAVEIQECLSILRSEKHPDPQGRDALERPRELSLRLTAEIFLQVGLDPTEEAALERARHLLDSGAAAEKFFAVVADQKGKLNDLPKPTQRFSISCGQDAWVHSIDTERLGYLNIRLGTGRIRKEDQIDPTAGFEIHVRLGDRVRQGDPLITLLGSQNSVLREHEAEARACFQWSTSAPGPTPDLVRKTLRSQKRRASD